MPIPRRVLARELGVLAAYVGLCLGMLWPLPRHMAGHVVASKYYWDAYTNAMALGARVQNVLGNGPGGHYESYFFAPIPHSIVFNENLFGLSLLYAPFHLATGNPLLAYNAVLLLSLVLSSYFTYRFVLRLTGSGLAGFVAGAAFPYCPYAFFEMGRIQLVATQWIPLSFLFLHRSFEQKRLRDLAGLGFAYAMQVGTCLYYAMFLLPLLGLLGVYLYVHERPRGARFVGQLALVAAVTGAIVGSMVFPYFTSRKDFDLTRSEDFAENFDGELAYLAHVDPMNRAWPSLHFDRTMSGPVEEIAFPGLTILALALFALIGNAADRLRRLRGRERLATLGSLALWLVLTVAASCGATLATHSLLSGTLVLAIAVAAWLALIPHARLLPAPITLYGWLLVLAVLLFLGLTVFDYHGAPVRGLYYYLYAYVPGWNGIRKISRQAIMTSFAFIVLAGYGVQLLLSAIANAQVRVGVALALAALIAFEFRQAPLPLEVVPAGDNVASAYKFIAAHPGHAPIALLPTNDGLSTFRGQHGMALHNYLALYHHRRTLNGKSSFIPPITRMFNNAMADLPSEIATRVLRELGAQYLVVHTGDMPRERGVRILQGLKAAPTDYRLVHEDGPDYVFEVLPSTQPEDRLDDTPALPEQLVQVPRTALHARASDDRKHVGRSVDGNLTSRWTTGRNQRTDDYYELDLTRPLVIGALELTSIEVGDAPLGYRIEADDGTGSMQLITERPKLRLFRGQVFHPRGFVFRVVFPKPVLTKRVRVTIIDPFPGRWWTVNEATLWAEP